MTEVNRFYVVAKIEMGLQSQSSSFRSYLLKRMAEEDNFISVGNRIMGIY